jgi:CDGSH-type Zn-finger protein
MQRGSTVEWTYKHHLNSRSFIYITKTGIIHEITGKVKNIRYVSGTHAKVLFKGNKHASTVPINELKLIENV